MLKLDLVSGGAPPELAEQFEVGYVDELANSNNMTRVSRPGGARITGRSPVVAPTFTA
jgi:hypothetical protein